MSRVSEALIRAAKEGGRLVGEVSRDSKSQNNESSADNVHLKNRDPSVHAIDEEKIHYSRQSTEVVNDGDNEAPNANSNVQSSSITSEEGNLTPTTKDFHEWTRRSYDGRDSQKLEEYPLVALEKNSPAGEQYKILREQIKKMCSHGDYRSIAITSPIKGDGKTTVAANLAAAMALYYEQQVLLVDADLRSPSIHSYFGISASPGLAEYLSASGDVDLLSYVQSTSLPGLRVLSAGKATSFHSELLGSERMKVLLDEISEKLSTHQIIFDTSPVLSTPDPLVLSQQLDGIVMVVRAGKTPRDCLSEAIKSLGSERIMGLVLNAAELGPASKYYYYYRQQP
ncbi:MAG: polysaccharide biosynthesis tyrosine autokinase [Deltaproteobacteria bacterium]|nr:polysaccharide biosynthesis tyrosine autokinase [Deltaproteobacteria bacterium]